MRIAMLTADYLPNIGGIAAHVHELSRALRRRPEVDVSIWYWHPDVSTNSGDSERGPASALVRDLHSKSGAPRARAILDAWPLSRELMEQMHDSPPDVIHVHTLGPSVLAARLARRRYPATTVILTNHSSGYLNAVQSRRGRLHARLALRGTDAIIAPSIELREESRFLVQDDRPPPVYIPNGVALEDFTPGVRAEARAMLQLDRDVPLILATRRFERKNGLRYLVEAMHTLLESVPDARLLMLGGAADREEWEVIGHLIEKRGLQSHVNRLGAVPNAKIRPYLVASDVVAVPSLIEATSISALEAMASARAVVATTVGGLPELVDDGVTGLLVPPRDPAALARALAALLTSKDLAAEMGRRGRERAQANFSWDAAADRTLSLYKRAADSRGARHV